MGPHLDAGHLLGTYGYLALFLLVAAESTGIPLPGETMLIAAGVLAGTSHVLDVRWVILTASAAAIAGDNLGYWAGRTGGQRLLERLGRYLRLDERRLALGRWLFARYGGRIVFFGRFVSILRTWAAFLAGVNAMRWESFLLYNALGGITWATAYGLLSYFLGARISELEGPMRLVSVAGLVAALLLVAVAIRKGESRLMATMERSEATSPGDRAR